MDKPDFSPNLIKANTLPEAWRKIIKKFEDKEELHNVIVHIENPKKELPQKLKKFENDITQWVKELQKPELESKILPFTHGQRIYRWGGKKDQFGDYVIPLLQSNRGTRRAIITIADPSLDCETDKHIPAPQLIQFTRDKQLVHVTAYYRAQEMYLFWPINIFELIGLQHDVCNIIRDIKPGSITTISFIAYSKPSDFPRISIEMFELSALDEEELEKLLNVSMIKKRPDGINNLIQKLTADSQKLERITQLKIEGYEVLKKFVQTHNLEIGDSISKKLITKIDNILYSFNIIDTYLKKGISSAIQDKIKTCQGKMKELIDIVKMFLQPKVFVASVDYGLEDIRDRLPKFLEEIGFDPIYFESEDFPVKNGHSHDICLDAVKDCDVFLLIIGPRPGGKYSGSNYPQMKGLRIVHAETKLAAHLNKPIRTFVRQNILNERKTYKDNIKEGREIKTSFADPEVFRFIDEIQHGWQTEQGKKVNTWLRPFDKITDLERKVESGLKKLFSSEVNER